MRDFKCIMNIWFVENVKYTMGNLKKHNVKKCNVPKKNEIGERKRKHDKKQKGK